MNIEIPYALIPRNKVRDKIGYRTYDDDFNFDNTSDSHYESLVFMQFLQCYAKRNAKTYKELTDRSEHYRKAYITADESRRMVEFYKNAKKNQTIYCLPKPYAIRDYWGDKVKMDSTIIITKNPYTEEQMFIEALVNDGIRGVSKKEVRYFNRLMTWISNSKGFWIAS